MLCVALILEFIGNDRHVFGGNVRNHVNKIGEWVVRHCVFITFLIRPENMYWNKCPNMVDVVSGISMKFTLFIFLFEQKKKTIIANVQ